MNSIFWTLALLIGAMLVGGATLNQIGSMF
jgi:hypothetical protein